MSAAVDTHAHIFVPDMQWHPVRRYTPDYAATIETYLDLLDAHGIERGVLIQPSFLGFDNSYILGAIKRFPQRLRGVAVVEPEISLMELDELDEGGMVGIRLNLDGLDIPDLREPRWRDLLSELRQRRWHVEVHRASEDLHRILPPLVDAGVNIVVDHFGRPNVALGAEDSGFGFLLTLADTRLVWVKLSAGYRPWNGGDHVWTSADCAGCLLDRFGADRLMWGSDWPHTRHESVVDFRSALAQLDEWVPDRDARSIILRETASALYLFDRM